MPCLDEKHVFQVSTTVNAMHFGFFILVHLSYANSIRCNFSFSATWPTNKNNCEMDCMWHIKLTHNELTAPNWQISKWKVTFLQPYGKNGCERWCDECATKTEFWIVFFSAPTDYSQYVPTYCVYRLAAHYVTLIISILFSMHSILFYFSCECMEIYRIEIRFWVSFIWRYQHKQ